MKRLSKFITGTQMPAKIAIIFFTTTVPSACSTTVIFSPIPLYIPHWPGSHFSSPSLLRLSSKHSCLIYTWSTTTTTTTTLVCAMGSLSFLGFLFGVLIMGSLCSSQAHKFLVGGKDGWGSNPSENYDHWAERNRFQVNDTLGKILASLSLNL